VLEHETDEDVVEGARVKGQGEDVRLPELDVGQSGRVDPPLRLGDRFRST
jgi:hypothetical protein